MAIIETFKKGQLVPKRLGVLDIHKKARHQIVFGIDVRVVIHPGDNYVVFYPLTEGALFIFPPRMFVKHTNGTYQMVGSTLKNVYLQGGSSNPPSGIKQKALISYKGISLPKQDLNKLRTWEDINKWLH